MYIPYTYHFPLMSLYILWICFSQYILIYPEQWGTDGNADVSLCYHDTVCLLHNACTLLLLADILAPFFQSLFVLHCWVLSFRKPLLISYHSTWCWLHRSFFFFFICHCFTIFKRSLYFLCSSCRWGCSAVALVQSATNETCTHYFKRGWVQNAKLSLMRKIK